VSALSLDNDNAQRQNTTTTTRKNAWWRMQHVTIKMRRDNLRWRRRTMTYDDDARQCTTTT